MTPDQLDQIARVVQDRLLNSIGYEIDDAMRQLGITEEISDDDWQTLLNLILA